MPTSKSISKIQDIFLAHDVSRIGGAVSLTSKIAEALDREHDEAVEKCAKLVENSDHACRICYPEAIRQLKRGK